MNELVSKTLIPGPQASKTVSLLGNNMAFLAEGQDTGGTWSLLHYTVVPRFSGPPAHWHAHTTEGFYILSGTLTFYMDGSRHQAPEGSFVLIPPGVVHRYANETDEAVRFLVYLNPAGFEGYFKELAQLIAAEPTWPPADMSKLERLTAKYDQHPPLEP